MLQFVLSIYGGYFGGGMGIMMLAAFSLAGMVHIHEMNALKTLLGVAINGLALLTFVVSGTVAWRFAAVMIAGSIRRRLFRRRARAHDRSEVGPRPRHCHRLDDDHLLLRSVTGELQIADFRLQIHWANSICNFNLKSEIRNLQ